MRRGRGKQPGTKGHGRKRRTQLPAEEIPHDLPEEQKCCPACGKPLTPFPGTEDSEEIHWEVRLVRRVHKRKRYRPICRCRAVPGIVTASCPPKLIPKGMFSCGFWVELLLNKYLHGMPLYRVIKMLEMETLAVSGGGEVPVIAKRAAETACVVPDGMTVVIGGLMEDNETEVVRKVPILGDIPWAGTLFRRTIKSKTKTELLIFLTTHVVQRTSELEPLSVAESQKADLAPVAFTQDELDKHLEGQEKLIRKREEKVEPEGALNRTASWLRSVVQIFK